jgi:hypothetical protein
MADIHNDNGGRTVDYWDQLNQRSWSFETLTYDGNTNLMTANFSNDNNTTSGYYLDTNNVYIWSSEFVNYNSSNQVLDYRVNNDNGTYSLNFLDPLRQHGWYDVIENYDATGHDTGNATFYYNGDTTSATPTDLPNYGDPVGFSIPNWDPIYDPGDGEGFFGPPEGAAGAQGQVDQLVSAMAAFGASGGAYSGAAAGGLSSSAADGSGAGALTASGATQTQLFRAA